MKKTISISILIAVSILQIGCWDRYHRMPRSHVPANSRTHDVFAMTKVASGFDESTLSCCQYLPQASGSENFVAKPE